MVRNVGPRRAISFIRRWLVKKRGDADMLRIRNESGRFFPTVMAALTAIALAGCTAAHKEETESGAMQERIEPGTGAEPAAENKLAASTRSSHTNAQRSERMEEPDSSAALQFVGRWAAEPGLCADTSWRFTIDSLETPAGSVCTFLRVTPVSGGYNIEAKCTAEGPETRDTLKLRFAESAGAMLFESTTIADAGLVQCTG